MMATAQHTDNTIGAAPDEGVRRRDFINIAAVSFAGVGSVAVLYPLINQMNPSADVMALSSIQVDLSAIEPGQAIKTIFRKPPLFVRHLTPQEIQDANTVPTSALSDPQTLAAPPKVGKAQLLTNRGACLPIAAIGSASGRTRIGSYDRT